jgi:hypothetical protein
MSENKNIELRSDKARSLIGQVPSVLLRYGIVLIGFIMLLLIGIASIIPYQESISISAEVKTSPNSFLIKASQSGYILLVTEDKNIEEGDTFAYQQNSQGVTEIIVPVSGDLNCIVTNRDSIIKGEVVAIITSKKVRYYAIARISSLVISKVKKGEKVLFDTSEGMIMAKVTKLKTIMGTKDESQVYIEFDKEHNKNLVPKMNLEGKIVISNQSLLRRLLNDIME